MYTPQEYLSWLYKNLQDRRNATSVEQRIHASATAEVLDDFHMEARAVFANVRGTPAELKVIEQTLHTINKAVLNSRAVAGQAEPDDGGDGGDGADAYNAIGDHILNAEERLRVMERDGHDMGGGDGTGQIGDDGQHSILVIDRLSPDEDMLRDTLERTQEAAVKRSYDIIYFQHRPCEDGASKTDGAAGYKQHTIAALKQLLSLVPPAAETEPGHDGAGQAGASRQERLCEEYNRYRYLRAVVIGPHLIGPRNGEQDGQEWKKIILTVRAIYPNMPIFIVAHEKLCGLDKDRAPEDLQSSVSNFVQKNVLGGVPIIFEASEMASLESETLIKKLDMIVSNYWCAPYWDALKSFTDSPVVSFHALPIGHRRSQSSSLNDFINFFGNDSFSVETSLAAGPLDSLQSPSGTLKLAQDKAAVAFGARTGARPSKVLTWENLIQGTRFVTNGTTTANKIVLGGHVRLGEYVLIDRNCHISHHYALAHCHAHPVYLQPFHNAFGISGPIPLKTIEERFVELFKKKKSLPAAIVLTNPTFDGIFYNPRKVIELVRRALWSFCRNAANRKHLKAYILKKHPDRHGIDTDDLSTVRQIIQRAFECIVFLFDEAWAAYAYFHPKMTDHTAMKTALDIKRDEAWAVHGWRADEETEDSQASKRAAKAEDEVEIADHLRIYSTQSTHKSLSALRQGSMIHFRDPMNKNRGVKESFDQSYRSNTSTSPSASILASLDVARRQAQMEGADLVERAIRLSKSFRAALGETSDPETATDKAFYVVNKDGMLKNDETGGAALSKQDYFVDPTRVTVGCSAKVKGSDIKKMLLSRDIQINKYNNRGVLSIFNIGVGISAKNTFIRALHSIDNDLAHQDVKTNDQDVKTNKGPDFEKPLVPINGLLCTAGEKDLGYWLKNEGRLKVEQDTFANLSQEIKAGEVASANFVVPYPPGFPVLVPGQMITPQDVEYLEGLANDEIHGTEVKGGELRLSVYIIDDAAKEQLGIKG